MVEAERRHGAGGIGDRDANAGAVAEGRQGFDSGAVPPVNIATLEGALDQCGVGGSNPIHLIEQHAFAAGGEVGGAWCRDVADKAFKAGLAIGATVVAEGAAADDGGGWRGTGLVGEGFRQHEAEIASERVEHERIRLVQAEFEAAVIKRNERVRAMQQFDAEHAVAAPAADGGHAILCGHHRVIVKAEAGAKGEAPDKQVFGDGMCGNHLRGWHASCGLAEQGIPDHVGLAASDRGCDQRVRGGGRGARHEAEDAERRGASLPRVR